MLLQWRTWSEVEEYLGSRDDIVIPIGSTEQHGPNGVLGTDALCAELLARGLGESVGALVAPTIAVGMAQHHLGFAGSMTLRPSTLMLVLQDIVASLARHGFRRFFFLNGHGANTATVQAAFAEIHAGRSFGRGGNAPSLDLRLRGWWTLPGVRRLIDELYGAAEGTHAMPSEIALMQFAFAEARRDIPLAPACGPRKKAYTDAADFREKFPDGRVGSNPGLATPEHGKRFHDAALADLAAEYRAWLAKP